LPTCVQGILCGLIGGFVGTVVVGAVYIEIVSQPLLVTAPLLKEMTSSEIVQWYGLSTVMHLVYGVVLGGILGHKLPGADRPFTMERFSFSPEPTATVDNRGQDTVAVGSGLNERKTERP
jgi:hypothetical protein